MGLPTEGKKLQAHHPLAEEKKCISRIKHTKSKWVNNTSHYIIVNTIIIVHYITLNYIIVHYNKHKDETSTLLRILCLLYTSRCV